MTQSFTSNRRKNTYLISQPQLFFTQFHTPTEAFGNAEPLIIQLSGELETNSAKTGVARSVDPEAGR